MDMDMSELVALRHWLHAHPQTAWEETETADYIIGYLDEFPPDEIIRLAGHGVAAIYNGQNKGPTVLIRTELDALPIQEVNELPYTSQNKNKSHKCGHDGHMTMVAGLAPKLHNQRPARGRVVLLFQPAEETGEGARAVYNDDNFKAIAPDFAFAIHNIPEYQLGTVICKSGTFSAAVNSIIIELKGKTAHAGEPEKGINPALAIAEIIHLSDALPNRDHGHDNFSMITPVHIAMGEKAYGTSAGYGELHFTLRAWRNKNLQALEKEFVDEITTIARKHSLKLNIDWTQEFLANRNEEEAVEMIRNAAVENGFTFTEIEQPFRWGEDFGMISSKVKGAMFGLGAGKNAPALHNPDYDFPDELLETGIKMYSSIIDKILNE